MTILCIIGPLCSGKSATTNYVGGVIAAAGRTPCLVSLDSVGHAVLQDDREVIRLLGLAFGEDIFDSSGVIDRCRLAERSFDRPSNARKLNAITHPAILSRVQSYIEQIDPSELVIIESPLPLTGFCLPWLSEACVIAVTAPKDIRLRRALSRGMSLVDARSRMDCQPVFEEYAHGANVLVENAGTHKELETALHNALLGFGII